MNNKLVIFSAIIAIIFSACSNPLNEKLELIKDLNSSIYDSSKHFLDRDKANNLVKEYEEFTNTFKNDTNCPNFLFKAGELSMTLNNGMRAITFFNRVYNEYPDYYKAPVSLFMRAFVLENIMDDKEQAKSIYNEFIQKYPNHELVKDAKATLENIDIPLDELIKQFEQKTKKDTVV